MSLYLKSQLRHGIPYLLQLFLLQLEELLCLQRHQSVLQLLEQ